MTILKQPREEKKENPERRGADLSRKLRKKLSGGEGREGGKVILNLFRKTAGRSGKKAENWRRQEYQHVKAPIRTCSLMQRTVRRTGYTKRREVSGTSEISYETYGREPGVKKPL